MPQYIGCYIDGKDRDLVTKPLYISNDMNIEDCQRYCGTASQDFYFGTQVGLLELYEYFYCYLTAVLIGPA